jgi:hypothetical protein
VTLDAPDVVSAPLAEPETLLDEPLVVLVPLLPLVVVGDVAISEFSPYA